MQWPWVSRWRFDALLDAKVSKDEEYRVCMSVIENMNVSLTDARHEIERLTITLRSRDGDVERANEALAVERQRLTDAYATINALKVAGASDIPAPMVKAEQDPVVAAIHARANKYPVRIRRQVIHAMSLDAMERRGLQEPDDSIIASIESGISVDGGLRPE